MHGTPNRRRFLRTLGLAGAAAVAGCTGDGGDDATTTDDPAADDGGTTDGEGTTAVGTTDGSGDAGECSPGHAEGDPVCQQVADDAGVLTAFEAGATDLLVNFEYPCGWSTSTTDQFDDRFQANATASVGESGAYFDVQVRTYYAVAADDFVSSKTSESNYDAVEYDYDGETRTAAVSGKASAQYGTNAYAAVPGPEGSLHQVMITTTAPDEPCGETVWELATAMIQSIEPNPETTFESA